MLTISCEDKYTKKELKDLFLSVGWAKDMTEEQLFLAMKNSTHYVTARMDGILVGFVRSMDDEIWSANIDCMVVHGNYQRQGIGTAMLRTLVDVLSGIHYISVMPNSPNSVPIYLKCGFSLIEGGQLLQQNRWED